MSNRFKIDIYDYANRPFGLYFAVGGYFTHRWKMIEAFQTRDEAFAFYEKVKDLPEYLP